MEEKNGSDAKGLSAGPEEYGVNPGRGQAGPLRAVTKLMEGVKNTGTWYKFERWRKREAISEIEVKTQKNRPHPSWGGVWRRGESEGIEREEGITKGDQI